MIELKLGLLTKLPKGVKYSHFHVWTRPFIDTLREWRKMRGRSFNTRLQAWREIVSQGDHYFDRGELLRPSLLPGMRYVTKEHDIQRVWSTAEVYLATVPEGMFMVSKKRHSPFTFLDNMKQMAWWENMYDACDIARTAARGWWWPYLTETEGGIVCAKENDAVLMAAELGM